LAGLAALPEVADSEIPAEMLGVDPTRRGASASKERLSPMKCSAVGGAA